MYMRARVSAKPRDAWGNARRGEGETYRGVVGPDGEVVRVERELLLEALDDGLVLEVEDGAVAGLEAAVHLALGCAELVCGNDRLQDVEDDVPELLVLVAKEENDLWARGTRQGAC